MEVELEPVMEVAKRRPENRGAALPTLLLWSDAGGEGTGDDLPSSSFALASETLRREAVAPRTPVRAEGEDAAWPAEPLSWGPDERRWGSSGIPAQKSRRGSYARGGASASSGPGKLSDREGAEEASAVEG